MLRVAEHFERTDTGRQLTSSERLKPSDVIRIGDTEYRYQE